MKPARFTLSLLLAALVSPLPAAGRPQPARPNVLFILTEDQGAHLGFLGTPGVQTPHMESLAVRRRDTRREDNIKYLEANE